MLGLNSLAGITQQQGVPAFNPETDITWHSLFWAEGTDFVALGLADGAAVATWPNETAEVNAINASLPPTYDAVNALFNDAPVVVFANANNGFQTANFTTAPVYTAGVSIIVVGRTSQFVNSRTFFDGNDATNRNLLYVQAGPVWRLFAGADQNVSLGGTDASFLSTFWTGGTGSENLTINGTSRISGDAGSQTLDGFSIGTDRADTGTLTGEIALVGIYEGDITADGEYANFKTWVTDHYGITVA
jgi:hypothetical protein